MSMKFDIVLYTEGLPFTGNTLNEKALGGSESAFIYLSRELARQGHRVAVYCVCPQPGVYDDVTYSDVSSFRDFLLHGECDIFICSRFSAVFRDVINAKLRILWNHDIITDSKHIMSVLHNIDMSLCLSEYHKRQYLEVVPELETILYTVTNGLDHKLCPIPVKFSDKKHQIMFTSRPERGLIPALQMFEQLGDKSLTLLICNYETIEDPYVKDYEEQCVKYVNALVSAGFDIKIGRFTKEELYAQIGQSKSVLYPSGFPEISCISAMEAQACGTVFLTLDQFALSETVGQRLAKTPEDLFEMLKLSVYDDSWSNDQYQIGFSHAQKYDWGIVAQDIVNLSNAHFQERSKDHDGILDRMVYESELLVAREYAEKFIPDRLPEINHKLRFVDGKESYTELYEDEGTHEAAELGEADIRFKVMADSMKEAGVKNILDWGCHLGTSSIHFANNVPDCTVLAYDISEKAIKKATKRAEKHALNGNVEFTTDVPSGGFDAIFLGEVLEHVANPESFVDDLESRLNPGGKMYLTIPRGAWESVARRENEAKGAVYHVSGFDRRDILDMFGCKQDFKLNMLYRGTGVCADALGNYIIEYTASGVETPKRDFKRKAITYRPYQSISVNIIAKNAERDIEHCISSVINEVDEVIVLDDQSTDATVSRAQNAGARVFVAQKTIASPDFNGFANARNLVLDKSSGKWIFWIDTDERAIGFNKIRRFLDGPAIKAFIVKQHHAQLDSFIEADSPQRLFKCGEGRFVGYIHEQPMCIDDINKPIPNTLILSDTKIAHFGAITESVRKDKAINRNLKLLEIDCRENPTRKMGKILVMRDFVNRIKWAYEATGTFKSKDGLSSMDTIKIFWDKYFKEEKDVIYKNLAFDQLQQAMVMTETGIEVKYGVSVNKANTKQEQVPQVKSIRVFEDELDEFFKDLREAAKSAV